MLSVKRLVVGKKINSTSRVMKKQLKKIILSGYFGMVALILAAHCVQLRGVCRESVE